MTRKEIKQFVIDAINEKAERDGFKMDKPADTADFARGGSIYLFMSQEPLYALDLRCPT